MKTHMVPNRNCSHRHSEEKSHLKDLNEPFSNYIINHLFTIVNSLLKTSRFKICFRPTTFESLITMTNVKLHQKYLFCPNIYYLRFKIHVAINHCIHVNTQLLPLIYLLYIIKKYRNLIF